MKTVLLQIVFIKKRWGCGIAYIAGAGKASLDYLLEKKYFDKS
jgi:hypothetical protein